MNATAEMPSRVFKAAARYFPTIDTPQSTIQPSNFISTLLLLVSFSLTYPRSRLAALFRVALFAPICYFSYDVAYGPHHTPSSRVISTGLTFMGLVGIMRAVDLCIVSLLDEEPPHWVRDGKKVPLPTTLWGRFVYAFDMLSTTRGTSWWAESGYSFDFSPKYITNYKSPYRSRITWLASNLAWLVTYYLLMDAFDTANHLRDWDSADPHPVTTLPLPWQLFYSLSIASMTYFGIVVPATVYASIFGSLGSSPTAWPPIFDRPFSATSLQDFWTHRWHHIFRRVFDRLTYPLMLSLPKSTPPAFRRLLRALLVFGLSAGFHLVLIERMMAGPYAAQQKPGDRPFMNPSILKFFLYQPVGLLIERALVTPLVNPLSSGGRVFVHRVWTWGWMLWTGRFWADAFVRAGGWGPDEGSVGWSPIRGALWGQWWLV